jgi:hypothetical protein
MFIIFCSFIHNIWQAGNNQNPTILSDFTNVTYKFVGIDFGLVFIEKYCYNQNWFDH